MAWCENEHCPRFMSNVLRKADVEFCEVTRKVLCHGCYANQHPGWIPPPEYVDVSDRVTPRVEVLKQEPVFGYALQITDSDGIKAKVQYGGISMAVHIPTDDLKRTFGV